MASQKAICSVAGCGKQVKSSIEFCHAHYMRFKRHGDPLAGRTNRGAVREYLETVVLSYCSDDCLIWPFGTVCGYGKVKIAKKDVRVNRYVCEMTHGAPPTPDHVAAHNCGNAICVNKNHIEWKTPVENQADRVLHGTDNRGEKSPNAKLSASQVEEVRALLGQRTQLAIAEMFGVSQSLIGMIATGQAWAYRNDNTQPLRSAGQ